MYLYLFKLLFPVSADTQSLQQLGYGSAVGFTTALIVGAVTLIYFRISKSSMMSINPYQEETMMTQNVLAPSGSPQLIRWTKRTVLWLFLIAIALLSLFPIILVLLGSFKTNQELTGGATIWPKIWQFSNYAQAWKTANFSGFTINSVFVSISTTVGTLLVASMSAYAVDRVNFKGKRGTPCSWHLLCLFP